MRMNELPVINKTVQNLIALRDAVVNRDSARFDMDTFRSCGMVCCAAGSLAETEYGQMLGLRFEAKNGSGVHETLIYRGNDGTRYVGYEACAWALGLRYSDSCYLFAPQKYRDFDDRTIIEKHEVLARIGEMIAKYS